MKYRCTGGGTPGASLHRWEWARAGAAPAATLCHVAARGCGPGVGGPVTERNTLPPLPPAEGITLPFKSVALIQEHGRTRIDVTVKARGGGRQGCPGRGRAPEQSLI